jgi:hypothetical protein
MKLSVAFAFVAVSAIEAFVPFSQWRPTSSVTLHAADGDYDFDVAIIGCGVGGHGAALHSRAMGLTTAVFAGGDVGGTCVNRGCVPSKALLAASGRVREMRDTAHLESLGIQIDESAVQYSREGIANHAKNLASRVKGNLENSLVALGCDVIEGRGALTGNPQEVMDQTSGKVYKCKVSQVALKKFGQRCYLGNYSYQFGMARSISHQHFLILVSRILS